MDSQHTPPEAAPKTRTAPPPFDKPGTDVILRSSDHVDFHVRKHILYEASPVFESILSIPPGNEEGVCPIVDLTEDHRTLHTLLLICYPVSRKKRPPIRSLPQLEAAIAAAKKYDMELPLEVLVGELLRPSIHCELIEIWAVGCRLALEDVASRAAGWVSMQPLRLGRPDVSGLGRMEGISAGNYYRLRAACKTRQLVPASPLLTPSNEGRLAEPKVDNVPGTQCQFRSKMPYPDLECRPADGVLFLVHKCILAVASNILAAKIEAIQSPALSQEATGGAISTSISALSFEEDASVLSGMFSLCYPGEHELSYSPSICVAVLLAAKKYAAAVIEDKAAQHWEVVAKAAPLLAYLVSSRAGLRDCARVAARYTLSSPLDNVYHPEMEYSPALSYCHLLTYHEHCRKLVRDIIKQEFPDMSPKSKEEEHEDLRKRKHAERSGLYVPDPVVKQSTPTKRYAWLYGYVEELVFDARRTPTRTASHSDVCVFEAAKTAGNWDGPSDRFLADLSRVDAVVRNLTCRLDKVVLEC